MATQIDPNLRELLWVATRATGVTTDVFVTETYEDLVFQIAGTGTWAIEFQTNLTSVAPVVGDVNWLTIATDPLTGATQFTAAGLFVPLAPGIVVPRVRAKLISFASGVPRVYVAGRLGHR